MHTYITTTTIDRHRLGRHALRRADGSQGRPPRQPAQINNFPISAELGQAIADLVRDPLRACDLETGLCRFCLARVEDNNPERIEPHSASCPWAKVRRLLRRAWETMDSSAA